MPPRDGDALLAHLDRALERAETLKLGFGIDSLSRIRDEIGATPA